jgi:hypothetical protein
MSIPSQNKYRTVLNVFDGGLNTKNSSNDTPINKSPDLQNVEFSDNGAVETTKGFSKYNSVRIATAPVDGLHEFVDSSNNRVLLAICNGSLHVGVASAFSSVPSSTSMYTSGVDVKMFTGDNRVFILNGYRPYWYDGTNFRQAGPSAPTGTASVASTNSGVLNGEYRYALTGLNEYNFETDYTVISSTMTATSGRFTVSSIPVFPTSAGISTKYLYRNTAGAATPYWRVTALSAAQTSIVDNNADTDLTIQAKLDQGSMPPVKYMCELAGFLFGGGDPSSPTTLYFSAQGEYDKWPVLNQLQVGRTDGLAISGLFTYGGRVAIHKADNRGNTALYFLSIEGSTVAEWVIQKSKAGQAAQSDKSIVDYNSQMSFLNRYGLYSVAGDDISIRPAESQVGQFGVDAQSYDIEPSIYSINKSYINKVAAIDFKNRIFMAVPDGTSTINNKLYTYDYTTLNKSSRSYGSWSRHTGPAVNNFVIYDGELLAGSANDGFIYALDQEARNYDTAAIDSYYWTSLIHGNDQHRYQDKVWRWLLLTVECTGPWLMYITYRSDTNEAGTTTSINLDPGGTYWGGLIFGIDKWGTEVDKRRYKIPIRGAISKDIQFKFYTNTVDQWWKVYEIEVFYTLRRDR